MVPNTDVYKYKAEWAGKMVDIVDPRYTSQNCSNCHKLVGRMNGDMFKCHHCELSINVHVNAAINIRDSSKIYQDLKKKADQQSNLSNRDAIARIHAFGEMTYTQIETLLSKPSQ